MASGSAEQPAKRRKKGQPANVITIGGKTISLDGYLDPAPKTKTATTTATPAKTLPPHEEAPPELPAAAERKDAVVPRQRRRNKLGGPCRARDSTADAGLLKARQKLPIWPHRCNIQDALRKPGGNVLVLVGETGSGKSTQVPQFLFREPWCRRQTVRLPTLDGGEENVLVGGVIAITQPRRVAATTLAHRVSREAGTPLGKGERDGLVGYSVRFDHDVPRGTRIKFLTEGTLLQELLRDPYLRQYSAVVVDEIHERSLDVDLLVGFLKQIVTGDLRGRGGIPLRVIIMSATADVDAIRDFWGGAPAAETDSGTADRVQVLRIEGLQFPVEVVHEPRPVADLQDALVKRIFKIHLEEPLPGDVLAFLTGQEEIESAQRLIEEYAGSLASNVPRVKVCPLYGQLSAEGQRQAFQPAKASFTRKIVLATNIAETSVTVPGVRYVVDCGKAKVKQYRPRLGMESLLAKVISRSSALQRTGRAGRESAGKCYRLYTESTFETLPEADVPEMLRNDVLGAVLSMKARGIDDVVAFPLMDTPGTESLQRALLHLHFLGALADDGAMTQAGAKMARLPIPAPLGAVLLAAAEPAYDCVLEAIDIVSCITAGDDIFLQLQSDEAEEEAGPLRRELQRREGDLLTYLTTMQRYAAEKADLAEWCRQRRINVRNMRQALNIRRQLRGMCLREGLVSEAPGPDPQPFRPVDPERADVMVRCFMRGFATKTAMLAPDGSYVTVQGKHVVAIHPASVLHGQKKEAIMFLDHVFTNKSYAKRVSAIRASWIVEALETRY